MIFSEVLHIVFELLILSYWAVYVGPRGLLGKVLGVLADLPWIIVGFWLHLVGHAIFFKGFFYLILFLFSYVDCHSLGTFFFRRSENLSNWEYLLIHLLVCLSVLFVCIARVVFCCHAYCVQLFIVFNDRYTQSLLKIAFKIWILFVSEKRIRYPLVIDVHI